MAGSGEFWTEGLDVWSAREETGAYSLVDSWRQILMGNGKPSGIRFTEADDLRSNE